MLGFRLRPGFKCQSLSFLFILILQRKLPFGPLSRRAFLPPVNYVNKCASVLNGAKRLAGYLFNPCVLSPPFQFTVKANKEKKKIIMTRDKTGIMGEEGLIKN